MPKNQKITIVVVCYERELAMLTLLARSVAVHASDALVSEIVVIDNSREQPDFPHRISALVLPEFGPLQGRVRVVKAADLGVDVADAENGYTAQQALKLEVCRVVSTDYYLVLDAKNHLVNRLDEEQLFNDHGFPLAERARHSAYLATCQRASFQYWGTQYVPEGETLPTVTPYLLVTEVVRRMLEELESRGKTVHATIAENEQRTEFLLYAGYIARDGSVDRVYGRRPRASATLYTRWPQDDATIERVITSAGTGATYAMGVHARRYPQLKESHIFLIARKWLECGLIDSFDAGVAFVRAQARGDGIADSDVLVGRGQRLSIDAGTNNLRDQHLGNRTLTDAEVAGWHRTLVSRVGSCIQHGAQYAMLIAPDTFSMFAEDFAAFGVDSVERPVMRVLRSLDPTVRVVYPLEALRAARAFGIIAHTADSHWSAFGASIAYKELSAMLPDILKSFTPDEIEYSHRVGPGDLGDKLDPQQWGEFTEARIIGARSRPVWNNGVNNRGYMALWRQDAPELPRGVLYMDSYGWKLQRFIAESFSSLFVVHSPYLEREPILRYSPDLVINLMAERFLIRVPNDETPEPALATAISKLPSARYLTREEYETGIVQLDDRGL